MQKDLHNASTPAPEVSAQFPAVSPAKTGENLPETPAAPLFALPPAPQLSDAGHALILDFETGGRSDYNRSPFPEAPDARFSGITQGIGYDDSTNAPAVIQDDWKALGDADARRLAATHPWRGRVAQQHLHEVRDILVTWSNAIQVFDAVDVARTFRQCRHAFPGFEDLHPNCQAAIVSLVFNRGSSMTGDGRREMRAIRDQGVPARDYPFIASQFRAMTRIWQGTEIYNGMRRRRYAEAELVMVDGSTP